MKKLGALVLGGLLAIAMTGTAMAEEAADAPMNLTLEDSVRLALDNNKTIRQYEADFESAVWARHQARRAYGPTINWQSTANKYGGKYYDGARSFNNTLALSMPIYSGGQLESSIKAADLDRKSVV